MFNILLRIVSVGGNMRKARAIKYALFVLLMIVVSLAGVMYALAYTVKSEVVYTQTFKIEGKEQLFRAFYLSAPAVLFEVKLTVSEGTIKWTPYSAVLFAATFDSALSQADEAATGAIHGWECETGNGIVKWRIDQENLNQVWYLCFLNEDSYEKEVTVEVTKVWSAQNIQDWM
jgi:hypothetical protein